MTSQQKIDDFLAQKRFAFVGVSRQPKDFSRVVFREFRAQGYEPVPVHPEAREIEGQPCYASIAEIQPPVESALLMTSPPVTRVLADACAAAGIRRVWMYRSQPEAVDICASHGISVIAGECPLMFLPGQAWFHRLHGWVRNILQPEQVGL
jgi:predicted CoA-binding protein